MGKLRPRDADNKLTLRSTSLSAHVPQRLTWFIFTIALAATVVVQQLSRVQLFATSWTVALQALLSMGFPRQEYWSGLLFPFPGASSPPRIELLAPASPALAGGFFFFFFNHWATREALALVTHQNYLLTWWRSISFHRMCFVRWGLFSGSCVSSWMRSFPFMGLYKYIQLVDFFCSIPRLSTRKHRWPPSHLSIPVPPNVRFHPQ